MIATIPLALLALLALALLTTVPRPRPEAV